MGNDKLNKFINRYWEKDQAVFYKYCDDTPISCIKMYNTHKDYKCSVYHECFIKNGKWFCERRAFGPVPRNLKIECLKKTSGCIIYENKEEILWELIK